MVGLKELPVINYVQSKRLVQKTPVRLLQRRCTMFTKSGMEMFCNEACQRIMRKLSLAAFHFTGCWQLVLATSKSTKASSRDWFALGCCLVSSEADDTFDFRERTLQTSRKHRCEAVQRQNPRVCFTIIVFDTGQLVRQLEYRKSVIMQ